MDDSKPAPFKLHKIASDLRWTDLMGGESHHSGSLGPSRGARYTIDIKAAIQDASIHCFGASGDSTFDAIASYYATCRLNR